MSLEFSLVKVVLNLLASNKRKKFIKACQDPEPVQSALKIKILSQCKSPFPDGIRDYSHYKELQLTHGPICFFETTSGSTGSKKRIPYTKSLLQSFENMFLLWAHDLIFCSGLNLERGTTFISISPQIGDKNLDDRKYLSPVTSWLLNRFLVSDPNHHKFKTSNEFLLKISRDLISRPDLEIISVWSPTYLLSLLHFMKENREALKLKSLKTEEIWPKLKLISCWAHAQAEKSAQDLKALFPGVTFQAKGLLLTEAPITIPWSEAKGNVPLVTETFFEFLDDAGKIWQLHELELNSHYIVLTTQSNGFLRYNTQDQVKVTGFYFKVPVLEFLGRYGQYSDLAGEKLSEALLQDIFKDAKGNFLFVPNTREQIPSYIVYTSDLDVDWNSKLKEIYHYQLAIEIGQLKPLEIIQVKNLSQCYMNYFQNEGMALGDIKERILLTDPTHAEKFQAWIQKALLSCSRDP